MAYTRLAHWGCKLPYNFRELPNQQISTLKASQPHVNPQPFGPSRCIKASFYIIISHHHFTSLKTDLISLQPRVLEWNFFYETGSPIHGNFLYFSNHIKSSPSTTSRELRQQFAARVDEDDNVKSGLKGSNRRDRLYSFFDIFLIAHCISAFTHVENKTCHQSARFENSWSPFRKIWIIFTLLKLWIASARHNFKRVKIQTE